MKNKKVIIVLGILLIFIIGCLGVKLFIDHKNEVAVSTPTNNVNTSSKEVQTNNEEFNSDIEIVISELNKENSESKEIKNKDLSLGDEQSSNLKEN